MKKYIKETAFKATVLNSMQFRIKKLKRRKRMQNKYNQQNIEIPKMLFSNPEYKNLSVAAKVAYGFLLDRTSLSKKNGERWVDENGQVFVYFTVREMTEWLDCSAEKTSKIMKELEDHNLISRTRQGQGKPWRVVVKDVVLTSKNDLSRPQKINSAEPASFGSNKNDKKFNKSINKSSPREMDADEILAAKRMVSSDDYLVEYSRK